MRLRTFEVCEIWTRMDEETKISIREVLGDHKEYCWYDPRN